MADIYTQKKRSEIMGHIRGKNTTPEIAVRSLLHRNGYRFRLHKAGLPGKPDIVLPKYKAVVFVHGCYWHRHKACKRGRSMPTTNVKFWKDKFAKTVARDKTTKSKLQKLGWSVITIWECELSNPEGVLDNLNKQLLGDSF